ncbi:MAG: GGDEF domain-containing protein [Wolinella sp.]
MIHLQKDENFKAKLTGFAQNTSNKESSSLDKLLSDDFSFSSDLPSESDEFATLDIDSPSSETLESFAKEVLKTLEKDNIPAIPSNFQLYFERLLEEKSEAFKKGVFHILDLEDSSDDDRRIDFEKRIKDSFKNMKNILQHVAVIYKNLGLLQNIVTKRLDDAKKADNSIVFQNVLALFSQELGKLNSITQKQTVQLKEFYQDSAKIVNSIDSETIFDSQFGIYNRRHLLSQIDKEVKIIDQFGHSSTVLLARLPDSKIRKISSEKMLLVVTRTIARLILKTSRRSDIIAHYGGGTFAMILKHSDLFSSKKACERLVELIQTTNIFIGETEINLGIVIGISKILPERSAEETLNLALNAMEAANLAQIPFAVCREDEEK